MHLSEKLEDYEGYHKIESWIGFFLGLAIFSCMFIFDAPKGMSHEAWKCACMGGLMAVWWSTEAVPIPIGALLPIILVPALGLGTMDQATSPYANSTIYLFLGGFIIGLAMEKWNLHRRIALNIINFVGYRGWYQIAGFMLATAFLSMWVSNSATAIMMLPIALSVITLVVDENNEDHRRFATSLLLAVAYGASIGGIATLIGTPPNALLSAFMLEEYDIYIGFAQWMLIGVPVSALMLVATWGWLCKKRFNLNVENAKEVITAEHAKLGAWSRGEYTIAIIFTLTAASWVFLPLLKPYLPFLTDTTIAIFFALLLFIVPINAKKRIFVMDWDTAHTLPWGTLLLFGGGLSLASAVTRSGLASWIAETLGGIQGIAPILVIGVIVLIIIFLTEMTSNTATAAAFLPLMGALAMTQGIPPEFYTVPAAIAASCAFMMPVATPPNTVIFGSGKVPIGKMIRAGFFLNIVGVLIVTIAAYFITPYII